MAKISKLTSVSVVASLTEDEAEDLLSAVVYVLNKFTEQGDRKSRDNLLAIQKALKDAGVITNGRSTSR